MTYFVQIVAAYFGSLGFALILKIHGRQIAYAGFGGALCWACYLIAFRQLESVFWATLIASIFVAFFAELMARVNKAPSTIFLTAAAIPMIPGANLYYMMYGIVSEDYITAAANGMKAAIVALAIGLGFVAVAVIMRYFYRLKYSASERE